MDQQLLLNYKTKLVCGLGLHFARRHLLFFSNLWPFPDVHDSPLCLKKSSLLSSFCCVIIVPHGQLLSLSIFYALHTEKSSHLHIKQTLLLYHCQCLNVREQWKKSLLVFESEHRKWFLCSHFQFKLHSFEVARVYSLRLVVELAGSSVCHVCMCQLCFLSALQNVTYWPHLSPSLLGRWKLMTRLRVRWIPHFQPNLIFSCSTGCFLFQRQSMFYFFSFHAGIRSHICIIDVVAVMLCHRGG